MELAYSEDLRSDAPEWVIKASRRIANKENRDVARPPPGVSNVLLHSCCAPCSGAMIEEMMESGCQVSVFFYNPNIHPKREYEIRKIENKKYCEKLGIPFIDCDYDTDNWYSRTKGMELDVERGRRCTICFDMRMERAALYAHEHKFHAIATTNATSRWKDALQVHESGHRAAMRYDRLVYWEYNWQSDEMTIRKYQISANEKFYKQEYCGCSYSLRDSNDWRKANGIPRIKIGGESAGLGERYFSDPLIDAAEESQEVVDEFFAQASELAKVGNDKKNRKEQLKLYQERRKTEAVDGKINGINNW